jgi:hypothetical protein
MSTDNAGCHPELVEGLSAKAFARNASTGSA